MKRIMMRVAMLTASAGLLMGLSGCNTAAGGGATGAGLGALAGLGIGAVVGDPGAGAAIGAIAGGVGGAVIGDQNGRAANGGQDPGWFGEKARAQNASGQGVMHYRHDYGNRQVWNAQTGQWEDGPASMTTTGTGYSTGPIGSPPPPPPHGGGNR